MKGEKGIVLRYGKKKEIALPGLVYVNKLSETLKVVDIRVNTLHISKQVVITKDNLTISIDAVLYYKVTDIEKVVFKVANITDSVSELAKVTLRSVIGTKTLKECLEHRDELAQSVQEEVVKFTTEWGIEIASIRIKDISVSEDISRALSSEAIAKTRAKALIITAEANVESAKKMKEASDVLNNESAMQIRYLQTLEQIGTSQNAKLIFIPLQHNQNLTNQILHLQDIQ